MTLRDSFLTLNARDRAILKSSTIAPLATAGRYTVGDTRIEIERARSDGPLVEVYARAWKGGVQVGFGADGSVEWERFRFFNPPIMVPDGTKRSHVTSDGRTIQVENCKEDPRAALLESLAHTIKVSGKVGARITPGKRGNTTSTFYPDADPESTSVDGSVQNSGKANWAAAHDAATGDTATPSATVQTVGSIGPASASGCFRNFLLFDTSSIPDADSVVSATLSVYNQATNNIDNDGDDFIAVITTTPASNTDLVVGDFDKVGTTEQHDAGQRKDLTGLGTGFLDWVLNATGRGNISKTGVSKFGLREGHDILDTGPIVGTGTSGIDIRLADQSGTSNDPKLVVVHGFVTLAPIPQGVLIA